MQKNANATVDASPAEHAEAQENNTCCSEPCSPEVTQANRLEAVAVPDSDIVLQLPRIPVGGTPTVDVPEESRRLLDRAFQGSEDVGSGDSLLDGVLQVARERGSILDGSLLETENLPQLEDGPDAPGGVASRSPMRKRAKAALRLLQAAEMLERTRPIDSARSELVAKMRAEAGKLLSQ